MLFLLLCAISEGSMKWTVYIVANLCHRFCKQLGWQKDTMRYIVFFVE